MFRPLLSLSLLLAFVLGSGVAAKRALGQDQTPVKTSYIRSKSFVTCVMRPRALLKYAAMNESVSEFVKMMRDESDINPHNIEQFVIQAEIDGAFDDGQALENGFSLVVRFVKPPNQKKIIEKTLGQEEIGEHRGHKYFKGTDHEPSICFTDDRTAIIAMESQLHKLIESPMGMGPLVTQVRELGADTELLLFIHPGNAGEAIAMFNAFFGAVLPPLAEARIHETVERITIAVKLSSDTPAKVAIEATSPDAARTLEGAAKALIALGKESFPALKAQIERSGEDADLQKKAIAFLEKLINAKVATDKKQVTITVASKGGMTEAVELFIRSVAGVGGGAAEKEAVAKPVEVEKTNEK